MKNERETRETMYSNEEEQKIEEPSEVALTEFEVDFVRAYRGRLIRKWRGCDFKDLNTGELIEVKSKVLRPSQQQEMGRAFRQEDRKPILACVEEDAVFMFELTDILEHQPGEIDDLKIKFDMSEDEMLDRRQLILEDMKNLHASKTLMREEIKDLQEKRAVILHRLTKAEEMERRHFDEKIRRERLQKPEVSRVTPLEVLPTTPTHNQLVEE